MSLHSTRISNRIRQRERRALETGLERESRRSLDRERHRMRRHRINEVDIDTLYYLGQMNELCQYCESLRFPNEQRNCCHNGKVSLTQLCEYPESFKELLMGSTQDSINFRNNIRNYNSAFAFASFGANVDIPQGHGTYCFRIHGQTYHCTNTLHPNDGEELQYGQLYIIEGSQAINRRMNLLPNSSCTNDVMQIIQNVMDESSPYAVAYKYMHEVEQEEQGSACSENRTPREVRLHFKRGPDQRRYNEPTHDEVAAVFIGEDGAPPANRDVVIYPKDTPPQRISYMSCNLDPMCYPLLFPRGDLGWYNALHHVEEHRTATRTKVTMQQFYCYRMAIREEFSPIHSGGKLFQQYAVDAYVKTEGCRLYYIRNNQAKLRVELYSGLMDHLQNTAIERNMRIGTPVVLPSTFAGSPRAMQQNYQDAMAVVAKYGKPDLFLTYTCNPKAREITENLRDGQKSEYRPDLVSRVFKLHLAELLNDIKNRHVLGVPIAHVHVIEFQKRGLPHCHMLIILRDEDKLRDSNDIDRIISAEIPDQNEDPELYQIVKSCMIHGPCGLLNPKSVCMENGTCKKKFPKEFREQTNENVNGYPAYRRRNNGRTVTVGRYVVDNRYVVPYNAHLLKKYRAHINIEACASVKSVKYLFKYIYKGHDCANMEMVVDQPNSVDQSNDMETTIQYDEIAAYLNCRYVSAPEAIWRLSGYKMHEQSHTIYRLAVHLPEQQRVYYREGEEALAADRASTRNTHLTAWFELNNNNASAHQILYPDIPKHYVFNDRDKKWTLRRRGGDRIISRMYSVSPTDPEKFYLRLLLLHVPGATCYDDLKMVDGILADSYREACIKRHLLTDDIEYEDALSEASGFQMPRQFRYMFATICAYCHPSDPLSIWNNFKEFMIEDLLINHNSDVAINIALNEINSILYENGTNCERIGLPIPVDSQLNDEPTQEQQREIDFNILNNEQRHLIDSAILAVESSVEEDPTHPKCLYVDAPGGSGKTFVFNMIANYLRQNGYRVSCAAWTGIAATLLTEGRTVHSLFKLPVPVVDTSSCNVSPTSEHANFLRNQNMFIIDEASMIPTHALNAIDRCLQDITGNNEYFGGKVMLLGGDFRQVLPVVPRATETVVIDTCLKRSILWQHFQQIKLTKNMRTNQGEQEFSKWLLELGNGTLIADLDPPMRDIIEIPDLCVVRESIVYELFANITSEERCRRVILSPKNEDCLFINEQVLKMLPGESITYLSADSVNCDNNEEAQNYPMEFLNSLTPSGMPPHCLNLKVGCIVMLLRNIALKKGLCNGTRLEITYLHRNCVQAKIIYGQNAGNEVLIPRIKLAPNDSNLPFSLHRVQFPLRLAYSVTINKAQGQTFDKVGIYLPKPVFSHGQLYVAFSRARALEDVRVKVKDTDQQGKMQAKIVTKNIVCRQVLS